MTVYETSLKVASEDVIVWPGSHRITASARPSFKAVLKADASVDGNTRAVQASLNSGLT